MNNYNEVLANAKEVLAGICNVCPDCNGVACKGKVPGVGAKGSGSSFTVCREFFKSVKIKMDAVHPHFEANTEIELFGQKFQYPFFVAPIGGMALNYGGKLTETEFATSVVNGARAAGTFAFTGDGPNEAYFTDTMPVISSANGIAISTIKPWEQEKCLARIKEIEKAGGMAVAMDVDSASLINLKLQGKPVYTKGLDDLKELVNATKLPLIVKGVMTPEAALRCAEAGCYGIVVSNHGGRVMDDTPAPASMIPEIRFAVGNKLKIFVDGGIRSGNDIFKCLALGADAVLIGRPYAIAAHGGREEGVKLLTEKLGAELKETMLMTDCKDLPSININKVII